MNTQRCTDDLLMRGADDLIQAAEVASIAMQVGGASTPDEMRVLSLQVIREVLAQRLMEIGDAVGVGSHPTYVYAQVEFQTWGLSCEAAMARVEREWKALGRNPNLGEICWLRSTKQGKERGEKLLTEGKTAP